MPIHSRWEVPIDVCSFQTYVFKSPTAPLPDKIAFYDSEKPDTHFLTHEDFRSLSKRLAAGLQKAGLKPGDRVLLFSGNNLFFPIAFLGVVMAGGIFTGANPGFVARELAHQLKDSEAEFLICADGSLEIGIEAAESAGLSKDKIFLFDDALLEGTKTSRLGVQNWATLLEPEDIEKRFKWFEPKDPKNTTICLNYSSGTTGIPKGVMISHYAYVANTIQFSHLAQLDPKYEQRKNTS
jgi:4-coumarate--CoA ligase